jgi:hypothetical protein
LVPYLLVRAWGDVQEVEIEQRSDALVIRPKINQDEQERQRIVSDMKAAGLIEDLPWSPPPVVSAEMRAHLAEKLSHGRPLSQIILEEREERA